MRSARNFEIPKAPVPVEPTNKRRFGRVKCQGIESELGAVLDISAAGMRIAVSGAIPAVGKVFKTYIVGFDGPVEVAARVVWVRKVGMWRKEAGISFEYVTPTIARSLAALARTVAHNEFMVQDLGVNQNES